MTATMPNRKDLASIAYQKALLPYHGYVDGKDTNLEPLIRPFPKWNVKAADGYWCAAFVYYCLVEAGFDIPYSPKECITCSLAGCGGFEEYAMGDDRIEYRSCSHGSCDGFSADVGDIVIYDNVFPREGYPFGQEHDHIGIIVGLEEGHLLAAEGNVLGTNTSGIVSRKIDDHIRCYVRIPDGYRYNSEASAYDNGRSGQPSSFAMSVYEYLQTIPHGKVATYGQIAAALGRPKAARAVGNILHVNPEPDVYPCYKVVNAKGGLAQHFGLGIEEQKRRLEHDGITVENYTVDLERFQHH